MKKFSCFLMTVLVAPIFLISCSDHGSQQIDLVDEIFSEEQEEIREVVTSIVRDAESSYLEGLKQIHLASDKFTKFGPRNFERQGVEKTNESESAFFGSVSNYKEEVKDLKIDVFGEVGIATYYREVSFIEDNQERNATLRQSLVFLKTEKGWNIVHEHSSK